MLESFILFWRLNSFLLIIDEVYCHDCLIKAYYWRIVYSLSYLSKSSIIINERLMNSKIWFRFPCFFIGFRLIDVWRKNFLFHHYFWIILAWKLVKLRLEQFINFNLLWMMIFVDDVSCFEYDYYVGVTEMIG